MSILNNIRLAFGSIKNNKLRSFLTMLGIIIGISSVITITTIGNSLQITISQTMNELGGASMIYSYVSDKAVSDEELSDGEDVSEDYSWDYSYEENAITYEQLSEYKKQFSDKVSSVIATSELGNAEVSGSKYTSKITVVGTTEGYVKSLKLDMILGRDISERDNKGKKATAVVSDLFVKYALNGENPIGKEVSVETDWGYVFKVYIVGVYKYDARKFGKAGSKMKEKSITTNMLVPVTFAQKIGESEDSFSGFYYFTISAADGVSPKKLAKDSEDYFNENVFRDSKYYELSCEDMASELTTIDRVLLILTIAISVIAAISLLVGGIGVMNIMLVSVVERTKEIGIRKAMGAKNSNIEGQFLMEAIVISLIGGITGILIGILNGYLLSNVATMLVGKYAKELGTMLNVTVRPSMAAIIISVAFSMLIGIIFGLYPAKRAAKMSPIDALRYE